MPAIARSVVRRSMRGPGRSQVKAEGGRKNDEKLDVRRKKDEMESQEKGVLKRKN